MGDPTVIALWPWRGRTRPWRGLRGWGRSFGGLRWVVGWIAASAPTFFLEDTPTAVLVRQVLGAIAQFEKAGLVAKLAAARKRKRVANGKCEGRKSLAETNPEAVALAKALGRKKPKGGPMSLRAVSAELAARGFLNERGAPFNHKSVASMLAA